MKVLQSRNIWTETNWFALHTKPRRESFAAANVSGLGVEILLPRIQVERLVRGIEQTAIKALFPGYFFARFCPAHFLGSIECTRGILQVVSSGRFPVPVEEHIIHDIQGRIQRDGFIRIYPRDLSPGTRVTITSGPFEGMMGRVERELDDRRRVTIFLETLLQARVLIERRWIEAEAA
jgi:transcriptional antiterminator RfaH